MKKLLLLLVLLAFHIPLLRAQDGTNDLSFNFGSVNFGEGANSSVYTIAIQPDGKILIAGDFTSYNGAEVNRIARLNPDGSLDPSFDPGTGAEGFAASIRTIILQPDGKILVGGVFTSFNGVGRNYIARLNADGSLDTSFNPGTGASSFIFALAIQSDGKILIGGDFVEFNGFQTNGIARLNLDGSIDDSFNTGTGVLGGLRTIALQSDGKIMIGGQFTEYNGVSRNHIARINSDGSLDASFDPGIGPDAGVTTLVIQPDNKILIGGFFSAYNEVQRIEVARLNSDGSLDASFDRGPLIASILLKLVLQPDGKILICGGNGLLARLNPDGSTDTGFDTGEGINNTVLALVIQPDGKVLIGGDFTTYDGVNRERVNRVLNTVGVAIDTEAPVINDCPTNITVSNDSGSCGAIVNWTPPTGTDNSGSVTLTSNFEPGSSFPVGTTVVTYTATDPSGNSATCSFEVNVVDSEAPAITCPADITTTVAFGETGAVVTFDLPTATDNCGTANVVFFSGLESGSVFPIGTTSVIYSAIEAAGNSASCSFTVTVTAEGDTEAPVINDCPTNITVSNDSGSCVAIVNWTPPTGTDNSGSVTLTSNFEPGSSFPVGTTVVTYTATDLSGNSATCSFEVNVVDTEAPAITCPADIITTVAFGETRAVVTFDLPTATDNCGVPVLQLIDGLASGSLFPIGITTVSYQAADAAGNTQNCSFSVTVTAEGDTEAPVINDCPTNITVSNDSGSCGAVVNWTPPTGTDNSGSVTLTSNFEPGSSFPVGTTLVTYTATDLSDNSATCSFEVNVVDSEAPVISCPENIATSVAFGQTGAVVTFDLPTATDNCGVPVLQLTDGLASGSLFPIGTTTVTYQAADAAGNTQNCSFTVTVTAEGDTEAPVINDCPTNITVSNDSGSCGAVVNWTPPTGTDNSGSVTLTSNFEPGSSFPVGTTVVTYTASDPSGNSATCSFEVNVVDSDAPVVEFIENISLITPRGVCSSVVDIITPSATDNCSSAIVNGIRSDGLALNDPYPVGLTSIIWEATDETGNVSSSLVQQIEIVEDLTENVISGSLDFDFPKVEIGLNFGSTGNVFTTKIQSDGKILIGGTFAILNSRTILRGNLARLNSDGTLDEGFNIGSGSNGRIFSIAILGDGKILVGGNFSSFQGAPVENIVRLNSDGSLDESFNFGVNRLNFEGLSVRAIQPLPNGQILIAGRFRRLNGRTTSGLARLNQDGSLDNSFIFPPNLGDFTSLIKTMDNKVFAGGRTLIRLNEEGRPDLSIDLSSITGELGSEIRSMILQQDGKLIVVGVNPRNFGINQSSGFAIRIDTQFGIKDPSFNSGRIQGSAGVNAVTVQKDGKIIIAGEFSRINNTRVFGIARLNVDGSLDERFSPPFAFGAQSLAVQSDGKILVSGSSFSSSGTFKRGIARLYNDTCGIIQCNVIARAKNVVVKLDENGLGVLNPSDVDDGSTSDCLDDRLQFQLTKSVFSCDDLGLNQVSLKVRGLDGAEGQTIFSVTVIDEIKPRILIPRTPIFTRITNRPYVVPDFTNSIRVVENCILESYTQDPMPGTIIEKPGNYNITLVAKDLSGNSTKSTFTLRIFGRVSNFLNRTSETSNNDIIEVPWNTPLNSIISEYFMLENESDKEFFESIDWIKNSYDPLQPGFYQIQGTLSIEGGNKGISNSLFELPIIIGDKPYPQDILVIENRFPNKLKFGDSLSSLITIDPTDHIHTYTMDPHPDVYLENNSLLWKGNNPPDSKITVNVYSTDRAGQTISREITLFREVDPSGILVYPNPAQNESNILVELAGQAQVKIRVFDAAGRTVYQEEGEYAETFVRNLDVRLWSSGLYHVVVQVDNKVFTGKLVKEL
ncbi:hypothetical protein Aoki45_07750 [Algoriphagus sp. oki45]|uniref:HYR domain-containing protein n=1 Tax=Algoriphagus sp. oki45 TaxID=3067294 RepID=UPI0027EF7960|nr:hypothetical protein Aoki45_07750 [Algoriphagus sp. oki45]